MKKIKLLMAGAALTASAMAITPANALTIVLNDTGGAGEGSAAFNGFTAAARFWESILLNDVTVNLDVGFRSLGPGILGSAGSTRGVESVGNFIGALQATGTTNLDSQLVTPTLVTSTSDPINDPNGAVNALISGPRPDGTGVNLPLQRAGDLDGGNNNSFLAVNTSVLKAVGLAADDGTADAAISFSSDFAFDFQPADGITTGAFDFVGIAIHEIGHALGFVSGVDIYDINTEFGGDIGNFAIMSALDLFRYSEQSASLGLLDWAVGGHEDDFTASYFSIDGGATNLFGDAFFSTGSVNGDGRQASHWRDVGAGETQRGIMDPTISRGTNSIVTSLDLAAFDAIGWNLDFDVLLNDREFNTNELFVSSVPEPGTWAMMIFGFGLVGGALRRSRKKVNTKVSFA